MQSSPPNPPAELPEPNSRQRRGAAALRCLVYWPIAMGVLWWPMFLAAWSAAGLEQAGMGAVASMTCHAVAYGLIFYLSLAFPVYWTAGRRWGWRLIPVVTSLIYIAAGSLISWWFTGMFGVFAAVMLIAELVLEDHLYHRRTAQRWLRSRGPLASIVRPGHGSRH